MSDAVSLGDFLSHYGVKGMKWGVTRDDAQLARIAGARSPSETKEDKAKFKEYKKNTSRQERRADKKAAIESRAQYIIDIAGRNPMNTLVQTRDTNGYNIVMTGREFVEGLGKGLAFNPMATNIMELEK